MMDDMGATASSLTASMDQYQGKFTCDRWDGHTVEIDPQTKRITRKMARSTSSRRRPTSSTASA